MSNPTSFSALKRSRGSVENLTKAIQQSSQNKREDERFWEPTVDKAGNGHAIIRFLPAHPQDGEDGLPWVRTWSHGLKGPGGWLIELCPTTLEQKCPVCEANGLLWNSGIEANKTVARDRKRKLSYTANILVVSDPEKSENNGKVKLFRFGKKIFDKIYEKMHPEFPDEVAFSPFDLWEGANFKLKIRKVENYRNYDKSEFASKSPVDADEAKMEAIWKSEFSLKEFLDPKNFKTYQQIKDRLGKVLGTSVSTVTAETAGAQAFNDADAGVKSIESEKEEVGQLGTPAGDPDDMDFFSKLAEQD
jgi:hypothetical protein